MLLFRIPIKNYLVFLSTECVAHSDPHYSTFNKETFDFQGKGRFLLSKDCVGKTFILKQTNDYCGRGTSVTCMSELLIQFMGNVIRFRRGSLRIAVNQKWYNLASGMSMCENGEYQPHPLLRFRVKIAATCSIVIMLVVVVVMNDSSA